MGRAPFYEPGLTEILVSTVASGKLRFSTSLADAAALRRRAFHLCRDAAAGRFTGG